MTREVSRRKTGKRRNNRKGQGGVSGFKLANTRRIT
jgi:hypothetical protein